MKEMGRAGGPALDALIDAAEHGAFGAVFFRRLRDLSDTWNDVEPQRAVVARLLDADVDVFSGPGRLDALGFVDPHARPGELERLNVATRIWRATDISPWD